MKLFVKDLVNSVAALNALANLKLPLKASYDVSKRIKKIEEEIKLFHKTRINRATELSEGKIKKEGNEFDLSEENKALLEKEVQEMLESEIDLNILPINLKDLGDVSIEPGFLANLHFLLKEDVEQK